jgi:hypothetical protein
MSGHMRLGGRDIELARARARVVNAIAERDGVVPPAASEPATRLVGDPARREELRVPGGHVTFATGRQALKHTMPRLAEWIATHSDERSATASHPGVQPSRSLLTGGRSLTPEHRIADLCGTKQRHSNPRPPGPQPGAGERFPCSNSAMLRSSPLVIREPSRCTAALGTRLDFVPKSHANVLATFL